MTLSTPRRRSRTKLLSRVAIAGIALAVAALGSLAVWAAIATQNGASGLSAAGVQVSGHLRAVQALSLIDTQTDLLEGTDGQRGIAKVRRAQQLLDDSLARMATGEIAEARRIGAQGKPIARRLKPAIEFFLASRQTSDERPEDQLDRILNQLSRHLNDLNPDPSLHLVANLETISATERTVRAFAWILIPLGLGGVVACGWLLSLYRRRSEAILHEEIAMSQHKAMTDELSGLPNRRALLADLELRSAANETYTLALADLNGFKRYNDTFGHAAGDVLLKRLGTKLAAACDGRGLAARLGGDEFCVVLSGNHPAAETDLVIKAALSETGEGFAITAASGVAAVPSDVSEPDAALRLADARMYAAKGSAHPTAEKAMCGAMMRMLDEHQPGLGDHVEEVTRLAVDCGKTLELSAEDLRLVEQAAQLHDVGKVAIPGTILSKEGPLDDEEWEYMRSHSIIGERILAGVPSLERAASLVRSSHEQWDGSGYPDGLAAEEIPLGARIIAVADSFCAMREDRPYAAARSLEEARQELRACSGKQFDGAVVDAFLKDSTKRRPARPQRRGAQEGVRSATPARARRAVAPASR